MTNSRRQFLKTSALAGTAAVAANLGVHAAGGDTIRIGVVGCGGRGSGAAAQCLRAGDNLKLTAIADTFEDRIEGALNRYKNDQAIAQKIDVGDKKFTGLDGYQKVLEHCDLVILATPPGFRPIHIEAAVRAGKHVFTEKPVAVDGPGIRKCLEAYALAQQKKLSIVAGTQRRYQTGYRESMKRIHDGDIGTITSARCYWNQGSLWHRVREAQQTDVAWQIRNWLYFTWLSGDHIVEQHVHNLDVVNWAMKNSHPLKAVGMGGRQVRTGAEFGHIFDHHAIDFEYPNGVHVLSMCRQIPGCANDVSEAVTGTKGEWVSRNYKITGEKEWSFSRRNDNEPYLHEHVELVASIRNGEPINDLKNVAESTLTAIMGRMSTYCGKEVTWEQALNSTKSWMPPNLTWNMNLPVPPVAIPGQTPFEQV